MATRISTLSQTISSDAAFQAWITEVDSSFLAFGWLHGADSGQLTVASAVRPGVANTYAGFVIYVMNDSLQGSAPCFVRIDYGVGTSVSSASLKIQIGTNTNNSGTLTGNVSSTVTNNCTLAGGNTACFTSGTSSRFCMAFWPDVLSNAIILSVERDRDASGNETGVGVGLIVASQNVGANAFQQFIPEAGGVPNAETKMIAWCCSSNATMTGANKISISPVRQANGPLRNPSLSFLVAGQESTPLSIWTLSFYSANHTFLALYPNLGTNAFIIGALTFKVFMLWE